MLFQKSIMEYLNFFVIILKINASEFIKNAVSTQDSIRCLYVGQREVATVTNEDKFIDIIGSDDATTCHIVLLVDESKQTLANIFHKIKLDSTYSLSKSYIKLLFVSF
jgi:hypothetical protein